MISMQTAPSGDSGQGGPAPSSPDWKSYALVLACFIACCALFVWALDRGYDFRDGATYLLWAADALNYKASVTEFIYFWHPIYVLTAGNITLYRLGGIIILLMCAMVFGLSVVRFSAARVICTAARRIVIISVMVAVFWLFATWLPTPNYNELNLCSQLLFFAGLLFSSRPAPPLVTRSVLMRHTIGPAALSGAALTIMALGKPTSGFVALGLVVMWLVLVRPQRVLLCVAVGALSSLAMLAVVIMLTDGSLSVFIQRKLDALALLVSLSDGRDVHGIWNAVVGPFLPGRRWKIIPAAAMGSVIFFISMAMFSAALFPKRLHAAVRPIVQYGLIFALAVVVAVLRVFDFEGAGITPAYHAWHFGILLILAAFAAVVFGIGLIASREPMERRWIAAAVILALVPPSYSFGTNNPIILHMTEASVFWVGSVMVLAALLPEGFVLPAMRALGASIGAATLGFFIGMMMTPDLATPSLWKHTVPVTLGQQKTSLLVTADMAAYLNAMKDSAQAQGLKPGTPIIDLSGIGPGLIFALGGTASGVPWLANNASDTRRFTAAVLQTIPGSSLKRSWIITDTNRKIEQAAALLHPIGLDFPNGYSRVEQARHGDFGWSQTLWKPNGVTHR